MDSLHSQISEFTPRSWIDLRKLCSGIWTSLLALLASDAGSRTWWGLVFGFVLLFVGIQISMMDDCSIEDEDGLPSCPCCPCHHHREGFLPGQIADYPFSVEWRVDESVKRTMEDVLMLIVAGCCR